MMKKDIKKNIKLKNKFLYISKKLFIFLAPKTERLWVKK
jgi:hypothetical protein